MNDLSWSRAAISPTNYRLYRRGEASHPPIRDSEAAGTQPAAVAVSGAWATVSVTANGYADAQPRPVCVAFLHAGQSDHFRVVIPF